MKYRAAIRFRLLSGEADFAVRRNTPESPPHRMHSPTEILRINDSGLDQRIQVIAARPKNNAKLTPKKVTATGSLGGCGRAGISSNIDII